MDDNNTQPISSATPVSRWIERVLIRIHGIREANPILRVQRAFFNWRLSGILMRRSELGKTVTQRLQLYAFLGRRFRHLQQERLHGARQGSSAAWSIISLATAPLVLAVVAVAALQYGPTIYSRYAKQYNWPTITAIQLDAYSGLMSTVAQAAAAMLALFFAAMSLVASTNYAKVSTDIRTLVAEDPTNRRYVRLLAHVAAVATFALGLRTLGISASALLVGYVCVLAGVGLLAFWPLGVRTFSLFEPSTLTQIPLSRLARAVNMVTHKGRHWLDTSFQAHANKTADAELRRVADLVVFAITENRPRQTVVREIAFAVGRLARFYVHQKFMIPSDSLWFTRRHEFTRWEMSSSSMTGIMLQTGVSPQPEAVPDHSFVETQCVEMTVQCLRHLLSKDSIDDAITLLLDVKQTVTHWATAHEQVEAIRLTSAVRAVVMERLVSIPAIEARRELQLVDVLCVSSLGPILFPARGLAETPIDKLVGLDSALLGLNHRAMYSSVRPRRVLKDAEELIQRLRFEKAVENHIQTQPWYIHQIIATGYAEVIRDVMKSIAEVVETEFLAPATALAQARRSSAAGYILQRGIEACHKAKSQIEDLESRYTELKRLRIGGPEWIESGGAKSLARVDATRAAIIRNLAAMVPDLCAIEPKYDLPDLLGQTRAWIAEELVAMIARKEHSGFAELFQAYFNATMTVQKHFVGLAQVPGKHDYLRVAVDAMLDLMDLSGLALVFTELDDTPFGITVTRVWDVYFDIVNDKPAVVKAWYDAIRSKLSLPLFSASSMQRQAWGQLLASAMQERGLDVHRHSYEPWRQRPEPHKSPVVESIVVMYGHPFESPHDIFGAIYLSKRPDASGVATPNTVMSCLDAIERARLRSEGKE